MSQWIVRFVEATPLFGNEHKREIENMAEPQTAPYQTEGISFPHQPGSDRSIDRHRRQRLRHTWRSSASHAPGQPSRRNDQLPFSKEAMVDDYDHVLITSMRTVSVRYIYTVKCKN